MRSSRSESLRRWCLALGRSRPRGEHWGREAFVAVIGFADHGVRRAIGVALLASIAAAHSIRGQNAEDLTSWMVDMSSHNAGIKVDRTLSAPEIGAPIRLVIHRVTIGTYGPPRERGDPLFSTRARAAADVGLLFGAYHVAFPTSDAKAQGEGFVAAVNSQCVPGQQVISAVDWEFVCVRWPDPGHK